jgi:hypothetical protein
MPTSGFTAGYLMTGFYFGHFRHQGVKIPKCHKPILTPNKPRNMMGVLKIPGFGL